MKQEDVARKRIRVIEYIKDLIKAREFQEQDEIEEAIGTCVEGCENILASIALDSNDLINVRAHAARLYIKITYGKPEEKSGTESAASQREQLTSHKSPLIRAGVVLGYGEAEAWDPIRYFLKDPHPIVVKEAKDALEDAGQRV